MAPDKAFILAAGFGKRLRPITDTRPKPMAEVAGITLIDRTIDHLKAAGITDMVINTHYRGEQLAEHLKTRTDVHIHISHEPDILDTGGGIKNALEHFGSEDFFVLSGDGLWSDGPEGSALTALAQRWNPQKMDILMLLQPVSTMHVTQGVGDYDLDEDGRAVRSKTQDGAYMFTSIRINRAGIFENTPEGSFSYLTLMDQAEKDGRLFGLVHAGNWHHISTPPDLEAVQALFKESA
ncbi:MAG: nucleotidyltransferase family protein [Alphaproteobacteria bacterium]|nr:nucleotidyltransferase family protein [Alphaproteobacteria bacterium]